MKNLARQLRNNSTLSEILFWKAVKGKYYGVEFHRQVPMLDYIVDFYCHELQLAIEIDGNSHNSEEAHKADIKCQKEIEAYGVSFLRFDDLEVKTNMNDILRVLEHKIEEMSEKHPPSPSSKGEFKHINNLQFITQKVDGLNHVDIAERACKAGVKWVQLRLKDADEFVWEQEAVEVGEVCQAYGATFIVNDNVEVAQRVMADGVHLGKNDMSPREARAILGEKAIIGATANTFEDVVALHQEPIDYIGLGPYKYTTTKENLSELIGLEGYKAIVEKCKAANLNLPLIAVGGIESDDVKGIIETGIYGVAISGALAKSENYKQTVKKFKKALEG